MAAPVLLTLGIVGAAWLGLSSKRAQMASTTPGIGSNSDGAGGTTGAPLTQYEQTMEGGYVDSGNTSGADPSTLSSAPEVAGASPHTFTIVDEPAPQYSVNKNAMKQLLDSKFGNTNGLTRNQVGRALTSAGKYAGVVL